MKLIIALASIPFLFGCTGKPRPLPAAESQPATVARKMEVRSAQMKYNEHGGLSGHVWIRVSGGGDLIFVLNDEPLHYTLISGVTTDGTEIQIGSSYTNTARISVMDPWFLVNPSTDKFPFCQFPLEASMPYKKIQGIKSAKANAKGIIHYYETDTRLEKSYSFDEDFTFEVK